MPRIEEGILETVVYLYPTTKAASEGERAGGSGFLVSFNGNRLHTYAVTASHVAKGAPVIRANPWKGDVRILETKASDWIHHPDGDDLAICHVACGEPGIHGFVALDGISILSEQWAQELGVGPGDIAYMIGRFVEIEDKAENTPAMRFGHIARLATKIRQPERGVDQLSYLVEMHSLPGYSGSAVFLLIEPGDEFGGPFHRAREQGAGFLLGVDWGHIPDKGKVRDPDGGETAEKTYVELNTGMACVVPAWKLQELLDCEDAAIQRKEIEKQVAAEGEHLGAGVLDREATDPS